MQLTCAHFNVCDVFNESSSGTHFMGLMICEAEGTLYSFVPPTGLDQQPQIEHISTFYLLRVFVVTRKSRGASAALDLLHGLLEIKLVTALHSLIL